MKKLIGLSIVLILMTSLIGLAWANKAHQDYGGTDEFCIMISPSTIVLSSPCDVITVHSNIPYAIVDAASVAINGVDVPFTKADDCGDLVAKIGIDALADFLQPGRIVTLTLSGQLDDGTEFAVDETITVKE